jgi:prepilin-type N-terminal cleavage/methylation domain-containing protein
MIFKKGFTLIELLVVISIIGILAALFFASFSAAQKEAKDTARKSDLKQYQTSLEQFANQGTGLYPAHTTAVAADTICGSNDLKLSITCPVDSKSGTSPYGYYYVSNGSSGISATKYALYAYLESSLNYWIVCSNGTTVTKSSLPSISDCP